MDGRVFRLLSRRGLDDWRSLSASTLFTELVEEAKLVSTYEVEAPVGAPARLDDGGDTVLEHEVIPFVSYPYEWAFGMLRNAALLQLELVRRAVGARLMLKDSSPYNVQFVGARPVFIDVGSFERLRPGEPWAGYRQFCTLFLYPLLLQAWKHIPFQPWLRGSLDGITPRECRSVLSLRDLFRRGALGHVFLHAALERRYEARTTGREIKRELRAAGFREELILANVRRLERLVSRLRPPSTGSAWSDYRLTTTYSEADAERKRRFVAAAVREERPRLVWDLGCNEGRHARIAAETADYVVAMDADAATVDALAAALGDEGATNILPLVVNVVDPSPGLGWRGLERRCLADRGRPDLALCLALLHHASITGNVPVAAFLDWLRDLETALVIEFPTEDDPMVQRLLASKRPGTHPDYRREWFERCLAERFVVCGTETLSSETRVLYHARPRA